jgi:hypothetical protein
MNGICRPENKQATYELSHELARQTIKHRRRNSNERLQRQHVHSKHTKPVVDISLSDKIPFPSAIPANVNNEIRQILVKSHTNSTAIDQSNFYNNQSDPKRDFGNRAAIQSDSCRNLENRAAIQSDSCGNLENRAAIQSDSCGNLENRAEIQSDPERDFEKQNLPKVIAQWMENTIAYQVSSLCTTSSTQNSYRNQDRSHCDYSLCDFQVLVTLHASQSNGQAFDWITEINEKEIVRWWNQPAQLQKFNISK